MRAALLLLLASAALLASCTAQDLDSCDIGDPAGLSRCIKRLLIDARPKVAEKADPLRVNNHKEGDLEASNIVIRGISGYSVDTLSVTFPQNQKVAVRATISWSHIKGSLKIKVRKCKKILWWNPCVTIRGRPEVTVSHTVGTLTTTLNVNVANGRKVTVTASGTNVSLNLARISVEANISGVVGAVNRIFGDPASSITTDKVTEWWRGNKGMLEAKARDALDKAVKDKVSKQLGRLLKL